MLTVLALTVALALPAGAAVVCRKGNGAMFVRDACKKKETPVDLAQFGAVGPTGPTGADGAPGADATALWAVVRGDGTLVRGSHVTSSTKLELLAISGNAGPAAVGDGQYEVVFDRDVTGCAYVATLGLGVLEIVTVPHGGITVEPRVMKPNGVFLSTFDETATAADSGFHLAVFCP